MLTSLLESKIKFLDSKSFSVTERFGLDVSHLKKRATELKQEKEELLSVLSSLQNENCLLHIDCDIKVSFEKVKDVELS